MIYLSYVWRILSSCSSMVAITFGNMLVFLYFFRPRFKWWLYPVLVTITYLALPMTYRLSTELFGTLSILMAFLGYWNDLLVLIAFRERFWKMISLIFTLCILNRLFTFWGYILFLPLNALTNGNINVQVLNTLIISIMYAVISLVCWLGLREKGRELIQTRLYHHSWIVMAGIAVFAKLIIDFCSDYAFALNPYSDKKIIWAMIALCTFSIAVLSLYLYSAFTMRRHSELKAAADRLTFEKEAQQRYYETQLHNQEELRRLKHDMNGHLSTVSRLLADGKKDEAVRYLSNLSNYAESHQKELYSDNPYLNAVVTNYAAVFAENGIWFEHDIQLGRVELHHVEMCLALNNALQNALEASLKLSPELRCVKLQIKTKQSRFLFRVTNRFGGEFIMDGGFPHTTKEDACHGYGLSSIRDAAESLGGFAVCKNEGDMFVLDVAM